VTVGTGIAGRPVNSPPAGGQLPWEPGRRQPGQREAGVQPACGQRLRSARKLRTAVTRAASASRPAGRHGYSTARSGACQRSRPCMCGRGDERVSSRREFRVRERCGRPDPAVVDTGPPARLRIALANALAPPGEPSQGFLSRSPSAPLSHGRSWDRRPVQVGALFGSVAGQVRGTRVLPRGSWPATVGGS
jgi:hypothetical protein